jgi:endonuclease/exonuclease/phosphatase (EEP) superfamily protein YafD
LTNFVKYKKSVLKTIDKQQVFYYAFIAIIALLVVLIIAGPEIIFFRQASEYLVHIMLGFLGLGFLFLLINRERLMMLSFATCATLCVFLKNESNGELLFPKTNNTESITLSHVNLSNVDHPSILFNELKRNSCDIVSFQELTPDWRGILSSSLKQDYPYSYEATRIDLFGKAIYSKYPLERIDTINKENAFDIVATINKSKNKYKIISPYLTPPLDKNSLVACKVQMKNISNYIQNQVDRVIVLGDFNMVYWSEEIRNFREASKLNNSRKDVILASMKLPYDHVFYSKNLQCVNVKDFLINRDERVGLLSVFQQNTESKRDDIGTIKTAISQ